MSDFAGVLVFVLGFAGCVVVLAGILTPALDKEPRKTLADRWHEMTDELHGKS